MSFIFYPYLSNNITNTKSTLSSQQLNLDQLKLAPYLPQLEKQAHLELSKVHMALAEQDDSIYASNKIIENMENSSNVVINTELINIFKQMQLKALNILQKQ